VTRRGTIPRIVTDEHCVSDPVNGYFNAALGITHVFASMKYAIMLNHALT